MLRQTKDRCIVDIVYWETAILGTLYFPKVLIGSKTDKGRKVGNSTL